MKKINVASTHLCPSFSLRSHQSTYDPPPIFISLLCLFGSMQQLLLLQSCFCFRSPPTLPSLCAPFSFIHILLPQQQQTDSSHRAGALPYYNLSLCFYLHSSSFPSSGDFTFISSSFTLHSSLSLCWCLPVSSFFSSSSSLLMCASLLSLLLLPNSLSSFSLFLFLSVLFLSVSPCKVL